MASVVINTREDLDAIAGTAAHDEFMSALRGTLWRLEKDDLAQTWRAVEENATIERFGFTRADFPGSQPPALPIYVAPAPQVFTCSPWQIRKALNSLGLRQAVEDAVATSADQALKDGWGFASEFRSDDPFVILMGATLGKSDQETAELIQYAAGL
ncbi:MAG: hypothetical protein ABFC42_10165 [Sulfuricella sp.]